MPSKDTGLSFLHIHFGTTCILTLPRFQMPY